MCGRYLLSKPERHFASWYGLESLPEVPPRWNIAPGTDVLAVVHDGGPRADALRWGLVPFWAKDPAIGNRLANARAESAHEKPSFRAAFKARRCLLPADGYYEWRATGAKAKRPYVIRVGGGEGEPFALAGLWERWRDPAGGPDLQSCTVLTTDASPATTFIHDRMPVIIPRDDYARWLSPRTPLDDVRALLVPFAAAALTSVEVSTWVNAPTHDDPRCIAPLQDSPTNP